MTREELLDGLIAGRTLVQDRKDAEYGDYLLQLQAAGKVTNELVQYDEQSSALKWRWVEGAERP